MAMPSMQNRSWQISPDALFQEIGGEAVILDLSSSTYFGLDPVGVRVWQLLQEGHDEQSICQTMVTEYDVDPERLAKDVNAFLVQIQAAGLLRVAGQ